MNKGLFFHTLATVITFLGAMYVTPDPNAEERGSIMFVVVMANIMVAIPGMIMSDDHAKTIYQKKI